MKFVDRTEEIERLNSVLTLPNPSFTAIYGRRRLGKSTLIKKVINPEDIYFLSDRSESQYQRELLANTVAKKFAGFDEVNYPDWESLFKNINFRASEKFTLVLDEFPYMVEQCRELPSVLQKLLDEKTLKYNIIICGSSQTMMYGIVLDASSPLYGRADEIIKLTPLRIPYIREALNLDSVAAVEEYAVWGGVPRYWELRENCSSFREALWKHVLSINGIFFEEPSKLFQDDMRDIVKAGTIISYMAAGANRLSEIAARCQEPATNLSRPLLKLKDLGFISKEVPFETNEKNSKKSLYKIADPFIRFYYKFVVPNRSFIELGRKLPVEKSLDDEFNRFISLEWESLCRSAITGNDVNGIVYGKAQRWWGSVINEKGEPEQIEIDLVAESIDKKCLMVGECKWSKDENEKLLMKELLRKAYVLPFSRDHVIIPVLFLKHSTSLGDENIFNPEKIISLSY